MATNPYVNKVELADGTTLMDISSDTVAPETLLAGETAHDRSGAAIVGTMPASVRYVEVKDASLDSGNDTALCTFLNAYTGSTYLGTTVITLETAAGKRETLIVSNASDYANVLLVSYYRSGVLTSFRRSGNSWAKTTYASTSAATQSVAGLMSSSDKTKLDGIAAGATANTGTITGITMNGASKGTSGVVDLGTVITAHQDISGKKNTQTAVSDPTASGTSATFIATISQSTQGVITATKKTVQSASTSQSGLMSAADKTKLDNTGVKSGNNNWWEAPNGQLCAYKYEGHNTTTYKLPHPHVVVLVMKESNMRGVALAIRWNDSANAMWIARLHGGTANTFSSWTPIVTSENEGTYFSNHLHWLSYSGKTSANGNLKVSDNLGDRWVVYAYCSNGSVIATPYWGSGSALWVHFTSDNASRSVIASTNVSGAVGYIS